MLGVVIWSAEVESKAIIWCEDHGELAFLGQAPHKAACSERFDEGDLIQFDVTELDNLRLARNPRRIAQHYCSDLGDVVNTASKLRVDIGESTASAISVGENVVPFDPEARRQIS